VRLKAGVSQLNLPHDKTYAAIRKKREAKGKDKNRCQELKAEDRKSSECINSKQLEGMCMELEAAHSKLF